MDISENVLNDMAILLAVFLFFSLIEIVDILISHRNDDGNGRTAYFTA